MAQYLNVTAVPGTGGFVSDTIQNSDGTIPIGNLAMRNLSAVNATVICDGPDGRSIDNLLAGEGMVRREKRIQQVSVTGNGATVYLDMSGPTEWVDPKTLGVSNATVNVSDATTHSALGNIVTLLGAGLPSALSPGGGVKVHDVGS